jgi:hypothetical protein
MENRMLYLAYDGDNAGRMVGRSILANDEQSLHEVSNRINLGHEIVRKWVEEHGGKFISGGGDEGTFALPEMAINDIEELRNDYKFATNLTMTVGIGGSLSEAGKSLLAGKLRGKNRAVQYDESVDQEIGNAHQRVASGQGSDEDKKLDEAYIKDPSGADKDPESAEASVTLPQDPDEGSEQKPSHDEGSASQKGDADKIPDEAPVDDDLPDSMGAPGKEPSLMQAGASEQEPKDTYTEKAPEEGNDMAQDKSKDQPNQPKEKSDEKADPKGKEGAGPSKEESQASPQEGQEEVKDGVSRPPNFGDKQNPGDMGLGDEPTSEEDAEGLSELEEGAPGEEQAEGEQEGVPADEAMMDGESPDFAGVLEDGLNAGADDIQKEKVVQMVATALSGFKAQKHIMERAKQQAPELYNSCITMLKAMIEMSKMLGLDAGGAAAGGDLFAPAEGAPGEEAIPGEEGQEGAPGEEGGAPPFGGEEGEEEGQEGEEGKEGKGGFPPKKEGEGKGKEDKKDDKKGPPKKDAAPKEGAAKAPKEKGK